MEAKQLITHLLQHSHKEAAGVVVAGQEAHLQVHTHTRMLTHTFRSTATKKPPVSWWWGRKRMHRCKGSLAFSSEGNMEGSVRAPLAWASSYEDSQLWSTANII